ncbi:MAG: nucleoid occlusion protein [Erysipelotrichaceae bacterium]|nr:nucleoid occlusion protein [Erysipelotrichaceae bacterium]
MKEVKWIDADLIVTNKNQPRLYFDDEALADLALSIKYNGLLQPIVVRHMGDHYEIIAGERRLRACRLNGMDEVPCILMETSDLQSAELALIENIQRQDLSAIEEAKAYVNLMRNSSMTQEEVAKKIGKSQASVANKIRLLNLPEEIQQAVSSGVITERHGRALLSVEKEQQRNVYKTIINKGYNVKKTEEYIQQLKEPKEAKKKSSLHGITKHTKIAMNTIEQAVKMINDGGIKATVETRDDGDAVMMVVRIPKQ